MSYATPAEVQSEFKVFNVGATTQVTTDEIQSFLDQTDKIIDSYLGTVYAVPITSSSALVIVKKIEIDIVASRVAKILQVKKAVVLLDKGIRQDILDQSAHIQALKYLKDLQKQNASLLDASLVSSGSGMSSYTETNNYEATFQRGVDQW